MKGLVRVIGVGGCGINVANDVLNVLKDNNEYLSNFECRLVDTTLKTVQIYGNDAMKFFHRIESKRSSFGSMDGTGGERKDKNTARDIMQGVKEFADNTLTNDDRNVYNLICFSGSGGTGSVAGPLLVKEAIEKGKNVIPVVIGDSSNLLNTTNTINTLNSLNAIAKQTKSAISVVYYNNTINGVTNIATTKTVNGKVGKIAMLISTFVSGKASGIDHQDMNNFFMPSKYKTFDVKPGVYNIGIYVNELSDEKVIIARTLLSADMENDIDVKVKLLHNKIGELDEETSLLFDGYPIYMGLRVNVIKEEINSLNRELADIKLMDIEEDDDDEPLDADDELGLIL